MYLLIIILIFVAKMFIQRIHKKTKTKTYTSVVLMENYREGGKVKHRIVSNLSRWPDNLISDFQKLLSGEKINSLSDLQFTQGKSMGAIAAIVEIAGRLGIKQALGNSKQASLALFQIAGRIITQGSRNYLANEWAKGQEIEKTLNLIDFNEDSLYDNLDWLTVNQDEIERKIFNFRSKDKAIKEVFLYDVTSSYFEGDKNELAEYGYNRDKKKGKKQIVIGLLTDKDGYPLSVEVFKGNTGDTQTVSNQLQKLKNNFGVDRVVFVGDKGMIKSAQIAEITSQEYLWNYLTTITKQQIQTLLEEDIIQLELFDNDVIEVNGEGDVRYILRRNPIRAIEIRANRMSKIGAVKTLVATQNSYLQAHKKATTPIALKKIQDKISKLKLTKIITATSNGRIIRMVVNTIAKKEEEKLDGCYVVKTNVPKESAGTQLIHDRYKDLAKVEFAFRTIKTTIEEIRPIYVRKEARTRGHVMVAMLAYMIVKYITEELSTLNYTRKFVIESLDKINYLEYEFEGQIIHVLPQNLLPHQNEIVEMLKLKLKT